MELLADYLLPPKRRLVKAMQQALAEVQDGDVWASPSSPSSLAATWFGDPFATRKRSKG